MALATAYTKKLRQSRVGMARRSTGSPVPWQRLVVELNDLLDKDAVIVEEVGTEAKVLNFFDFADDAKLKIGRTEGRSLGWGTGAAAGVQLALPEPSGRQLPGRRRIPLRSDRLAVDLLALRPADHDGDLQQPQL